jgi:DNA repair exonuclease SbcCD ATPase subunit
MMKKMGFVILIGLLLFYFLAFGQGVYKWVDEKGTAHFTDDLSLVPDKYRDQVSETKPQRERVPPPPVESPKSIGKEQETQPPSESASEEKDLLGRGEEWWRAAAKEWNQKLETAQNNYERTYNEWKSKEQELESSKFKPDSLKRKLKVEVKALEEKTRDYEKQVEEAKNMLENVLPQRAREYRANPDWLIIENP